MAQYGTLLVLKVGGASVRRGTTVTLNKGKGVKEVV
jgi:hypothetical protein